MAGGLDLVYETIDRQHAGESAHTRRRLVAGAAAALGGMGLLALPGVAGADPATPASFPKENTPERILTVAATAEVLATIVNTVGFERGLGVTRPRSATSRRPPARSSSTISCSPARSGRRR